MAEAMISDTECTHPYSPLSPHRGPVQFGIPLSGSSWEDVKLIRGTTCVLAGRPPPPPAQAADFRATAPLELDRAGVCCTSGHFLWIVSSPGGFSSPDSIFLPMAVFSSHGVC